MSDAQARELSTLITADAHYAESSDRLVAWHEALAKAGIEVIEFAWHSYYACPDQMRWRRADGKTFFLFRGKDEDGDLDFTVGTSNPSPAARVLGQVALHEGCYTRPIQFVVEDVIALTANA